MRLVALLSNPACTNQLQRVRVDVVFILPTVSQLTGRERRRRLQVPVQVRSAGQRLPVLVQPAPSDAGHPTSSLSSASRRQRRRRLRSRPTSIARTARLRRPTSQILQDRMTDSFLTAYRTRQ